MAKTIITDKAMQARPKATDAWLIESGARGDGVLVGRISPAGARTFYYRYTGSAGQRVRLPIGSFDPRGDGTVTFTVAQARDQARELTALYRAGTRDLREHFAQQRVDAELAGADARRAAEAARREQEERDAADILLRERRISVRALFERWVKVELQARVGADGRRVGRKDGGKYTAEQFGRYVFPALGDRAIADTTKSDLMAILDEVKAAGKLRTANVLLADLKQMFRFALAREVVERNPLDTVTKRDAGGTDTLRERVLSVEEIAGMAKLLPAARLNPRTDAAVWVLLATGARVGELMGASWGGKATQLADLAAAPGASDVKIGFVDLDSATWHLPTTKNEREHTIHLSPFALAQFAKLHELREVRTDEDGTSHQVPWVFPNSKGTGPVCVKSFGKQLSDRQREPEKRLQGRSKRTASLRLAGGRWTAHDLRRTAGTLMASMEISGDVIDECLNHVIESRVRRTYIRDRRPVEQARAFDALGVRLDEIISGKQAATNVVGLHATAARAA